MCNLFSREAFGDQGAALDLLGGIIPPRPPVLGCDHVAGRIADQTTLTAPSPTAFPAIPASPVEGSGGIMPPAAGGVFFL